MRKPFLAILLLVSTTINAAEISKSQLIELLQQNKAAFEDVQVGMTAEYHSNYFSSSEGQKPVECRQHESEVVVSADQIDKYLVYVKSTLLYDCLSSKRGTVSERLEWRELGEVDISMITHIQNKEYSKLSLNDSIITMEGDSIDEETNESYKFKVQFDVTKSQFYDMNQEQYGEYSSILLRRSVTDTRNLNLENLPINEINYSK